jgi:hypothetical protein
MAIKKFNTVAGLSVGENASIDVIDAEGNVTAHNLTTTGLSDLGNVANVRITGGTAGYVLSTDGNGNLSWGTNDAGAAGANFEVQFNLSGQLATNANFTFNPNTETLTVSNFSGNGSGLTGVSATTSENANYANYAGTAFSVDASNVSGQVGNALIAGTVYTNSQPNITSVGTLTGLTVDGTSNLGPISNVIITGGSNGQYVRTDGSGNLSWGTIDTSSINNGNSNVNIATSNSNITMSVAGNANIMTVTSTGSNVQGYFDVTGNTTLNNLTVSGTLIAGDIAVSSIANGTSNVDIVGVSGNVTLSVGGNANIITATSTGANVQGYLDVTGNTTLNNLTVSGTLIAGDIAVSSIANGTSNVDIVGVSGNVTMSVGGNANILTVTGTGVNVNGTFNTTGNITSTDLYSTGNISFVAGISANGDYGNIFDVLTSDGNGNTTWNSRYYYSNVMYDFTAYDMGWMTLFPNQDPVTLGFDPSVLIPYGAIFMLVTNDGVADPLPITIYSPNSKTTPMMWVSIDGKGPYDPITNPDGSDYWFNITPPA